MLGIQSPLNDHSGNSSPACRPPAVRFGAGPLSELLLLMRGLFCSHLMIHFGETGGIRITFLASYRNWSWIFSPCLCPAITLIHPWGQVVWWVVSTQGLLVKVSEGSAAHGVGVSQRTLSVCHSLLWRLEGPRGGLLIIKVQARIGCSLMPGPHVLWLCISGVWVEAGLSIIEALLWFTWQSQAGWWGLLGAQAERSSIYHL